MEMEMELDSRSHPTASPMLPSGDIALADATALPLPPPSRQEPASPSPVLSPTRDIPARRRHSKPLRPTPVDQSAGAAATPRRKRRGAGEPRAAAAAASPRKNVRRSRRRLESDGGREETGKEAEEDEDVGKARRRKTTARGATAPKGLVVVVKEKDSGLALVPCPPTNRTREKFKKKKGGRKFFAFMAFIRKKGYRAKEPSLVRVNLIDGWWALSPFRHGCFSE